jgi:hypothetical protein
VASPRALLRTASSGPDWQQAKQQHSVAITGAAEATARIALPARRA